MKPQADMFPAAAKAPEAPDSIYTKTTGKHLIYEPSLRQPHVEHLVDRNKTASLETAIRAAGVSDKEKQFLLLAAQRHNGFNFDLIADYYAHAGPEMQALMEASGLVIVDLEQAIELGFVALSERIAAQYTEEVAGTQEAADAP